MGTRGRNVTPRKGLTHSRVQAGREGRRRCPIIIINIMLPLLETIVTRPIDNVIMQTNKKEIKELKIRLKDGRAGYATAAELRWSDDNWDELSWARTRYFTRLVFSCCWHVVCKHAESVTAAKTVPAFSLSYLYSSLSWRLVFPVRTSYWLVL